MLHRFLCDLLNLIYPKPEGEEYKWTWIELASVYGCKSRAN